VFFSGSLAVVDMQFLSRKVEFPWGGKPHISFQQKESLLMKTKLLLAAVMFLCFTVAAFAQATYTVGSTPVTTVVESGYTERTGDVTFTPVNPLGYLTVTGTITVDYNDSPITFLGNVVVTPAAPAGPTVTLVAGDNPDELVLLITPGTGTDDYNIRITGVRVQVAGDPGVAPLNVEITSVGNLIVAGQTTPRVLNAVHAGIQSFTGTAPVRINAVTGVIDGTNGVALTAVEGFRNAFGVTIATDGSQANVQQLEIVLDKAVPAGITVTFPANDSSGDWVLVGSGSLTSASAYPPTVYYGIAADTDVTTVENFQLISVTIAAAPATSGAYADTTLNASISLAPIHYTGSAARPRYAYVPVGLVPLISFYHPTTTLLLPFAYSNPPVEGEPVYDTGIALANTSVDPGLDMTFTGAVEQSGTFKFYLYSSTGDVYTADSTALDDKDILEDGVLPAGKSYTILLSQVLDAAEAPELFSGYVFIICQFTNGHGEFFVTDFNTFTHGALMLVINDDRNLEAENLNN